MAAREAEPATGGLRAELAPYLPTRRTLAVPLRALSAGSGVLLGRGLGWVRGDVWPRLGYVAGGGYLAVHTAAQYGQAAPYAAVGGACAWCVAAWLAAPAHTVEDPDEETPGAREDEESSHIPEDVEEALESTEEQRRTALLHWLDEVTRRRNGVHLAELYGRLRERPALADLTDPQLRAVLDRYGIPVERTLSVDGVAGKSGVRRSDVEALLDPTPPGDENPSPHVESGSDLRESQPLSTDSRLLSAVSQPRLNPPGDGLDEHIDDALDLIRPTPAPAVRRTA